MAASSTLLEDGATDGRKPMSRADRVLVLLLVFTVLVQGVAMATMGAEVEVSSSGRASGSDVAIFVVAGLQCVQFVIAAVMIAAALNLLSFWSDPHEADVTQRRAGLHGALSLFLVFALMFAGLYSLVLLLEPSSFTHIVSAAASTAGMEDATRGEFGGIPAGLGIAISLLFFSFETQSLVGLGDVVPAAVLTQLLAALQQVIGVCFSVFIIAQVLPVFARSAEMAAAAEEEVLRSQRLRRQKQAALRQFRKQQQQREASIARNGASDGNGDNGDDDDGEDHDGDGIGVDRLLEGLGGEPEGDLDVMGDLCDLQLPRSMMDASSAAAGGRRGSQASGAIEGASIAGTEDSDDEDGGLTDSESIASMSPSMSSMAGDESADEPDSSVCSDVASVLSSPAFGASAAAEGRSSLRALSTGQGGRARLSVADSRGGARGGACSCRECWDEVVHDETVTIVRRWVRRRLVLVSLLLQVLIGIVLLSDPLFGDVLEGHTSLAAKPVIWAAVGLLVVQVIAIVTTSLKFMGRAWSLTVPALFQAYLALALAFSGIYLLLFLAGNTARGVNKAFMVPQRAWQDPGGGEEPRASGPVLLALAFEFAYFSIAVQTSVGFGDVSPQIWFARVACIAHIVISLLFNSIVLGYGLAHIGQAARRREKAKRALLHGDGHRQHARSAGPVRRRISE